VERLIEATRGSGNEARDRCLVLLMFRHGLRVSEACRLKLDQLDTESRVLHVARLKGGLSTTQPWSGVPGPMIRIRVPKPADPWNRRPGPPPLAMPIRKFRPAGSGSPLRVTQSIVCTYRPPVWSAARVVWYVPVL
jgi:hypothetical protein